MAQIDGTPDWLAAPLTIVAEQASLDGKTFLFVKTPYLDHCVFLNEFYLWPPALYPTWTQVYRPAPIYANEYAHFVTYEDRIYFARRIGDSR